MDKSYITKKLKPIIEKPNTCGFDIYLVTKEEPRLKELKVDISSVQTKLKSKISEVINVKYLAEETVFDDAENIADNQNKFYVIQQSSEYNPFDLGSWEKEEFKEEHLDSFMGFLFHFRYNEQDVWCFQKRRNITVTNRKKTSLTARIKRFDQGIIFEELNEQIVNFTHAIDIMIFDNCIITDDISLMERSFNFQSYIRHKAKQAAEKIAESKLFSGMEKLNEYLASDAKSHNTYRKKIMKAMDSPVLEMSSDDLIEKVKTLPRWKDKFKAPVNGTIPIDSAKEIEAMIDLLSERFTISPVSGQEYDTEVKKKADDI